MPILERQHIERTTAAARVIENRSAMTVLHGVGADRPRIERVALDLPYMLDWDLSADIRGCERSNREFAPVCGFQPDFAVFVDFEIDCRERVVVCGGGAEDEEEGRCYG